MFDASTLPSDPVVSYHEYGFAVVKVYTDEQAKILDDFAKKWINDLLTDWFTDEKQPNSLESYHIWSRGLPEAHRDVFKALNRYRYPDQALESVLINDRLKSFLSAIGLNQYKYWDDGWGWIGFRFIRPGASDGYPFTRKAWGVSEDVVSCWVPIIGHSSKETLTIVPGSHKKQYENCPDTGKFSKNEYRLATPPQDNELYNPTLQTGEIIFYHPETIHSEDVLDSDKTRLSLEFRFKPY